MLEFAIRVGAMGDRIDDSDAEKLKHRFLVWMGVCMIGGGLAWGTIAASFGLYLAAVVPYGYIVITLFNFVYFRRTNDFVTVRFIQVFISLALPFLFQIALGGFTDSGAVMLWAMLALVGSLTFSEWRSSVGWLITYVAFTSLVGFFDGPIRSTFSAMPPPEVQTAFAVINIVLISVMVFGLAIYLNARHGSAHRELAKMNEDLEYLIVVRTAEARAAAHHTEAIIDNLADGLVTVDSEGRMQLANPAFSALLGIDEEASGSIVQGALPGELVSLAARAIANGEAQHMDVKLMGDRTCKAIASPIFDSGSLAGAVLILRDITIEVEIDRMKTDFIATVSHELRTPLTSILGFAKLTSKRLNSTVFPLVPEDDKRATKVVDRARTSFEVMITEGQRLTDLINNVLDISKMEAGQMEWKNDPIEPQALIDRTVAATSILIREEVAFNVEVQPDLPLFNGDFDRLLQMMINLVSNAAKFTDEGEVVIGAERVDGGVMFFCADSGPGIPGHERREVFQKFRQVGDTMTDKPSGTGLGLPISRQIARAHGGEITLWSKVGTGSRFSVTIPVES